MAGLLTQIVQRGPDALAIRADQDEVSWAQLDERVNRWIDVLRGYGLRVGDRVAFVTGNRTPTFEALLACLHAGLVAVPVSWRLTASEIAYLLEDSDARLVLTEPSYGARVADALRRADRWEMPGLVTGDDGVLGFTPAEKVLADADPAEPAGQCSGSVMLYTSATTGHPKGVTTALLVPGADLDRVRRTVAGLGAAFRLPTDGRGLLVGPWYHAAQVFFSLFPLLRGSSMVLRQRFDAAATLADLDREQVTICHLVPTQFIRLLAVRDGQAARDGTAAAPQHLRRVWHGGAACPVDVKARMIEWWGPILTEYYAATEAGIVTTIDSAEWLDRRGSVGRPVPRTGVLILGPDGAELPAGETGTVYVRRSSEVSFTYHNAPEKTAAAHRTSGTFTVGDLGRVDEDGYLYLTGRGDDTIISGGVNIYPAEIESVLAAHEAVADVVVFGVPDEEFGERVMAVVELAPGAGLAAEDAPEVLDAHCRASLAGYKRPRAYRMVDELPREPTGKLSRAAMRAPHWQG